MKKGLYSFPHKGGLLVEVRFLTWHDPCKTSKYKEEFPDENYEK
jgi:hypothetical protein